MNNLKESHELSKYPEGATIMDGFMGLYSNDAYIIWGWEGEFVSIKPCSRVRHHERLLSLELGLKKSHTTFFIRGIL